MAACQSAKMTILWKKFAHAVGVEQKSPRWQNASLAMLFYVLSFLLCLMPNKFPGSPQETDSTDGGITGDAGITKQNKIASCVE